jgi:ribonuclease Z
VRFRIGTLVSGMLAFAALQTADLAGQSIRVTLLGTGGPLPSLERFGPATLIEAGGQTFLVDAGRGAVQRLAQARIPWRQVDGVLLTHLHSDHVVGLPDLWLTGWLVRPGRDRPLTVWGPRGTGSMLAHLREAFAFDIQVRQSDDRASPTGVQLIPVEIADGVVHDSGGVRITVFSVDHGPVVPTFGYRIDYGNRSLVVSGDTRVSENLIRHATGVDLLIHEVASRESFVRAGLPGELADSVVARHVTPEQAGQVFARTHPRLAVFSHIAPAMVRDDELIPATRREYSGRLEVGVDLMVITIDDSITVSRPDSRAH